MLTTGSVVCADNPLIMTVALTGLSRGESVALQRSKNNDEPRSNEEDKIKVLNGSALLIATVIS